MTSIKEALQKNDPEIFVRSVHKTKTTLSILNDKDLLERISIIQTKLKEGNREKLDEDIETMISRCKKTIEVLGVVAAG